MFWGPIVADRHLNRSRVEGRPFPALLQPSPVNMANEMLQAHDAYYMDDRMTVLSVCILSWISRRVVKFLSVWRETLQNPLLALEGILPGSVTSGGT